MRKPARYQLGPVVHWLRYPPDKQVTRAAKFRLGDWLVDPSLDRISRGNQNISLQPQVMDLLLYLARHPRTVVSNEELLEHVWSGRVVTMSSIYSSLKQLRDALGDDAHHPRYVQTVPKRGYRLIAEVELLGEAQNTDPSNPTNERASTRRRFAVATAVGLLALTAWWLSDQFVPANPLKGPTHQASLAVLPFSDLEADQDQARFADGIAAEIVNELGQVPGLRVTGSSSSFAFRDKLRDPQDIGRTLGVSLLLLGSVQSDEANTHVEISLVRTLDGSSIWTEAYDQPQADTAALPRQISTAVAATLGLSSYLEDSTQPAALLPTYTSYERYLQATSLMEAGTKTALMGALDKLEKALQQDPGFARAHVAMADVYLRLRQYEDYYQQNWLQEAQELALPHLEQAIALEPNLGEAYAVLGDALMGLDEDRMLAAYHQAIDLNPNLARAHLELAVALNDRLVSWQDITDQLESALEIEPLSIPTASALVQFSKLVPHRWDETEGIIQRLSQSYPSHPDVQWLQASWLLDTSGSAAAAIQLLEGALQIDPDHAWARDSLATAWFSLGEFKRAREFTGVAIQWRSVLDPDREAALRELDRMEPWQPAELDDARRLLSAYAHVMLRDWQGAIDLLAEASRDPNNFLRLYTQNMAKTYSPATTLAVAHKALGHEVEFAEYLSLEKRAIDARTDGGRLHNFQYSRVMARLHALDGRPYHAQLELERLLNQGPLDPRELMHPAFDAMRSSTEFARLVEIQRQRVNGEREKLGLNPLP